MSKYLIKILSICAFVILLPLVVLGSALCVTEAMGISLTIYEGGETAQYGGTTTNIAIIIDGVEQEGTKITFKKNTDVTVTWTGKSDEETVSAYDFQGWYKGNPSALRGRETTKSSYTFTVRGNTVLTAVKNVKKYTVTYAGKYDDGTDIDIEPATVNVQFNQDLAAVAPKGNDLTFSGWYDVNNAGTVTKKANFAESGEYTLNPVFSNQMFVKYFDKNGALITYDIVSEGDYSTYNLLSGTDERVVAALTSGYEFDGWAYDGDTLIELPEFKVEGYELYLAETAKDYNVTVKFNAISEDTSTIIYNAKTGFAAYNVTRFGYTFKGLVYDGVLYTYNASAKDYVASGARLSSLVIANEGLEVTAKWQTKYSAFNLAISAVAEYEDPVLGEGEWALRNDNGILDISGEDALSINFVDDNDEDSYDVTDNVFAILTQGNTNIRTQEGNAVAEYEINIQINNSQAIGTLDMSFSQVTFHEIMAVVEQVAAENHIELSALDRIAVQFLYELA